VDVLVFTRFENFEVAIPTSPATAPATNHSIYYQSGLSSELVPSVAQDTVGERMTSIRQYCMIPKKAAAASIGATSTLFSYVLPWYWTPVQSALPSATALQNTSIGYGSYFSKWYAFARGGTDVHVYSTAPGAIVNFSQMGAFPALKGTYAAEPSMRNQPFSSGIDSMNDASLGAHARFPNYLGTARVSTALCDNVSYRQVLGDAASRPTLTTPSCGVIVARSGTTGGEIWFTRAAADDMMLGAYMGPCPLFVNSTTTTGAIWDPDSAGTVLST
jgi:hypothetical protein